MESPRQIPVGPAASSAADDEWKAKSLVLRGYRQSLLASNIANAETPGYKARDFNFSDALRLATSQAEPPRMTITSQGHIGGAAAAEIPSTVSFVRYANAVQPALDGNTVDMDRERAALALNAIQYQFALTVLGDELEEFRIASSDPNKR
ncbi:MAG: flagellar basal body rod protein FlgB [Pseudomonadota bacterium]